MTYREKIVDYIRAQAKPPDKFSHQARLFALARTLAGDQGFDEDVLFAAAWMHDLGVFIGHRPEEPAALARWDNVAYALTTAPALLKEFGFPPEKIPAVLEVIRTHLPSTEPVSFEGILLRDADILEQLGSVGILRTVSKIGRDTRFITFGEAIRVLERNARDLPKMLKLPAAQEASVKRVEVLQSFLEEARSESMGENW